MNRLLLISFFLLSQTSFAQPFATLEVETYEYYGDDKLDCYRLIFTAGKDTLSDCVLNQDELDEYDVTVDSLTPNDKCWLTLYSCADLVHPLWIKSCSLKADQMTHINLYDGGEVDYYELDEKGEEIVTSSMETAFSFSSLSNRWLDAGSPIRYFGSVGFSQFGWWSVSRHLGFLTGGGMSLSHYSISKDTSFAGAQGTGWKKQYEYYNYLNFNIDMKLRLSLGRQNTDDFNDAKALLDLGAKYNFPLIFRNTAWYEGFRKTSRGGLHQFSDVQLYANLGWEPFVVFLEYRPFDFLKGNYVETPQINLGFRVLISDF